jgi:hypothetical protein
VIVPFGEAVEASCWCACRQLLPWRGQSSYAGGQTAYRAVACACCTRGQHLRM